MKSWKKTAELSVYVKDRSPTVHFLSRSYVLPSGGNPTIPIVSVNTDEVETAIYRVGNRSVADILRDERFLRQLDTYQADQIEDELGEKVWSGIVETENRLNQDITTAIPVSETGIELKPGVYAMTARSKLDVQKPLGSACHAMVPGFGSRPDCADGRQRHCGEYPLALERESPGRRRRQAACGQQ
ncbi:hypothetical protein QW131_04900 [Roseibium salinum]|nr:hypothetical protein [Roseibium salinum]